MTESTAPVGDDESRGRPEAAPPSAPATSPIPLDEDEIRDRAARSDDDDTDSVV